MKQLLYIGGALAGLYYYNQSQEPTQAFPNGIPGKWLGVGAVVYFAHKLSK